MTICRQSRSSNGMLAGCKSMHQRHISSSHINAALRNACTDLLSVSAFACRTRCVPATHISDVTSRTPNSCVSAKMADEVVIGC